MISSGISWLRRVFGVAFFGTLIRFDADSAGDIGAEVVAIHQSNVFELDALGADSLAFTYVGAASEDFLVSLRDHRDDARFTLGLTLREQA
jgi:hypothetical protein